MRQTRDHEGADALLPGLLLDGQCHRRRIGRNGLALRHVPS
jgi:hypothetical protein